MSDPYKKINPANGHTLDARRTKGGDRSFNTGGWEWHDRITGATFDTTAEEDDALE